MAIGGARESFHGESLPRCVYARSPSNETGPQGEQSSGKSKTHNVSGFLTSKHAVTKSTKSGSIKM